MTLRMVKFMLGVRSEIEAAQHCAFDSDSHHLLHHLDGALAQVDAVERDLEGFLADAFKAGVAEFYARHVIAGMKGERPSDLWCAVEGCQEKHVFYDPETTEWVCQKHIDYGTG